jgi:phage-related protein
VGSATSTAPATTSVGTTAANPGIGAYGQRGIIAELNALVQDLSGTSSASGVSPRVLSNLNSAFEKLISDLKGTSSAASTSSASTSSASTSSTGSTSPAVGTASSTAAAGTSDQSTAALQSFLTNFAQDLKNNGANSFSPLGSSVNTTA